MRLHNWLLRNVLIIVSGIVLVSCQPITAPTQSPQNDDIQDVRVQVVEPVRTTSKVEQFPLPNCGGTDKLEQSLGTYASTSKSATVSGKASVTGGGEVGIPETTKLKLEIQVELAYQQTFESANSRLDSIKMSAAAGTHVVYTIVWEEQTFNSIVQYSADGKVYDVPYTYKLSVPKIDTSYNVQCTNDNGGSIGGTPVPPSTVASSSNLSPAQALCPFAIKQSVIDSWKVGVADVQTVQSYISRFDADRPGDGGTFPVGTIIPAGVVVATNFDEREASKWFQYPVTAIVHSGSWGLFQTVGEYTAPNAGACRVITP
jgi:hypothetical protein